MNSSLSEDCFKALNCVLVDLFNEIMSIEDMSLATEEFSDLSNNDMHVIDAIGLDRQRNMSSIAADLKVTMGALTVAMNALCAKGYVDREHSVEDRRKVLVRLTEKGEAAYRHHENFHREMVSEIMEGLSDEEMGVLTKVLNRTSDFFREKEKEGEGTRHSKRRRRG